MSRIALVVTLSAFVLAVAPARAQQKRDSAYVDAHVTCERPSTSDTTHYGAIRGTIIEDSTGKGRGSRGVFLMGTLCEELADSSGDFVFATVPAGSYRISVGDLGIRAFKPVSIVVRAGEVTRVELHTRRPENLVLDCEDLPECAAILHMRGAVNVTPANRLREAALRTTAALLIVRHWRLRETTFCVTESDSGIVNTLRSAIGTVVSAKECGLNTGDRISTSASLVHKASGSRAVQLAAPRLFVRGDRADVDLSYYVGPLYAEGWFCRFERQDELWIARSCVLRWIS